jgi:hypothetical protein
LSIKSEPFFSASKIIKTWQHAHGGCPASSCAFIQMHGKAASSCPMDTMFMSSGIGMPFRRMRIYLSNQNPGRSPSSVAWYTDTVDRPIKRLKTELMASFPTWNVSLPSDSTCTLTATDNVFGRLLNGIAEPLVCTTASTADLTTGEFIHIEQAKISRGVGAYDSWTTAFLAAFEPSSSQTDT